MAKWILAQTSITPTAYADTSNMADNLYPFLIQGGSATQKINILEVYIGGQAGASTPTFMMLSRDSTAAATAAAGTHTNAALDVATAALAAAPLLGSGFSGTKPQRAATLHLLNLSLNAFGGIVRWVAAPGEEICQVGASANTGETSLSAFTGGTPGLLGTHMIYEPF
jgi:hypothetical protein